MLTLTKKENSNVSQNQLSDYVAVFDNLVSPGFCDDMVSEFRLSDEWLAARIGGNVEVDRNIRNVDTIRLSRTTTLERNPKLRAHFDKTLHQACVAVIRHYKRLFPACRITEGIGFDLLRYETGGFYKTHTDSYKRIPREVACSFALNEDYLGGEWSFFHGEKDMRPGKGSVVVFPSNFMFPHEIKTVTAGTRYSVVTWFS